MMGYAVIVMSLMAGADGDAEAASAASRQAWFREAQFGFIIHYSLFSLPPHEGLDPYACNVEMRATNRAVPGYEVFADQFKPTKFEPKRWLKTLQAAGARYIVFTTKNHDGFCLFDSALTDYDCVDHGAGRDLVREVVEAGREVGLKVILYYSMLDWHHPAYHDDLPTYVDFMHGQVRELCTNYGPIDGIWFDGEWDHPLDAWRSKDLVAMIRELQPLALINDRLGLGERGKTPLCDFYTREQMNEIGHPMAFEQDRTRPWEACMTIGNEWVYRKDDTDLKSTDELVGIYQDIARRGGNWLLNVGLTAEGDLPTEFLPQIEGVGKWMAKKTETLDNSRGAVTLYVSKLGDNSDGSSWDEAFHTIQAATAAIPDDQGGHRVIVRPDTYPEAIIHAAHKGAPGAYNELVGDFDGALGSGATGWVVIDSGAPEVVVRTDPNAPGGNKPWMLLEEGDPKEEYGLKSIDWWGTFRCDPEHSASDWDRWTFRNLYFAGSEGSGWDLTCEKGAEFTTVTEHCVAIGRFAGMCVGAFVGRRDEPVVFRDSFFMCMDWWGDAAGVYVRAENPQKNDYPDVVIENCTLVGPDNALQAGNPGFDGYSRVHLKGCRLFSLNFSQPHGQPSTGVIYSTMKGDLLHVDLEDCILAGYKVFGAGGAQFGCGERPDGGPISYTTKGNVRAYVHFRQPVPAGIERLRFWPVAEFESLLPPEFHSPKPD